MMLHPILTLACAVTALGAAPTAPLNLLDSMDHWTQLGGSKGSFVLEEGVLSLRKADGTPGELLTKADFENFELDFEFNVASWRATGLYFHAPRNRQYRAGLELELSGHPKEHDSPFTTGAIFRRLAPEVNARKKPGEWNTCRIHMDWPHLRVTMNDQLVQDVDLEAAGLGFTLRRGAIGFQNSGQDALQVRNMVLTPLPDSENGIVMPTDPELTGWTVADGEAKWVGENGVIRASGGNGHLVFNAVCTDFDFRCYLRSSAATTNGGIHFRWPEDNSHKGQEVQIYDVPGAVMPTGSLYGIARCDDALLRPGEWMLIEIIARGSHVTTYIDGRKAAETFYNLTKRNPGRMALQMHSQGWIEFKDLVLVPKDSKDNE
ncbi:MAG: DUF1080 domain-containing protein [Candidatus Hydrogenedentota bacterium]